LVNVGKSLVNFAQSAIVAPMQNPTRQMTSIQLYRRLMGYVAPYWRAFSLALLGMLVMAATEPALPALMKPMLDGTFINKDQELMRLVPLLIVALFAVRGVASYLGNYAINWVGNKLVMDLRAAMFDKLLTLPARYYADQASGNLISKLTFDVTQVTHAATNVVTVLVKDTLTIVGLLAWMFYLNWKLSLLTLLMAPVIVLIVRLISGRLRKMSREAQQAMGDITQVLQESIENHKVVKLYGGQQYESQRFQDEANRVRRYTMKQAAAAAFSVPVVQMVAAIALAVIVYLATQQSAADETTVGSFVSFIVAMLMLTAPLKRLTGVNEFLQRGLAAAESVFSLLDQNTEPDTGTITIDRTRGELRFEQVSFRYASESRTALEDITLTIAPGETVALVGPSGSGKTTLANLVPRFFHPTTGKILLDGNDLAALKLTSLRANIALVSQEVTLFNDTVAANIAYGAMGDATETEIIAAAQAAHAMEFILEMPQGLQTLVGEHGVKLSGGQRQRIAIARALLKNAPILILDEATSALDSESERHVQAALETLMQEIGNHRELLAKEGVYAKLYRIQFAPETKN